MVWSTVAPHRRGVPRPIRGRSTFAARSLDQHDEGHRHHPAGATSATVPATSPMGPWLAATTSAAVARAIRSVVDRVDGEALDLEGIPVAVAALEHALLEVPPVVDDAAVRPRVRSIRPRSSTTRVPHDSTVVRCQPPPVRNSRITRIRTLRHRSRRTSETPLGRSRCPPWRLEFGVEQPASVAPATAHWSSSNKSYREASSSRRPDGNRASSVSAGRSAMVTPGTPAKAALAHRHCRQTFAFARGAHRANVAVAASRWPMRERARATLRIGWFKSRNSQADVVGVTNAGSRCWS